MIVVLIVVLKKNRQYSQEFTRHRLLLRQRYRRRPATLLKKFQLLSIKIDVFYQFRQVFRNSILQNTFGQLLEACIILIVNSFVDVGSMF